MNNYFSKYLKYKSKYINLKNKLSGGVKDKKSVEKPKKNIKKPIKKKKPKEDDLDADLKKRLVDGEFPELEEDVLELGKSLQKHSEQRNMTDDKFQEQFNKRDGPYFTPITDVDERAVPIKYGDMLRDMNKSLT